MWQRMMALKVHIACIDSLILILSRSMRDVAGIRCSDCHLSHCTVRRRLPCKKYKQFEFLHLLRFWAIIGFWTLLNRPFITSYKAGNMKFEYQTYTANDLNCSQCSPIDVCDAFNARTFEFWKWNPTEAIHFKFFEFQFEGTLSSFVFQMVDNSMKKPYNTTRSDIGRDSIVF